VQLATAILQASAGLDVHGAELLSTCVWKWTEADGQDRGCRWLSAAALDEPDGGKIDEHVVPQKLLVEAMVALREPTAEALRDLLATMAIACIVTRAEDARLSEATWEKLLADPRARYRGTGVVVVDTRAA